MSQKLISSFFKCPPGFKRTHEDIENSPNDANKKLKEEDDTPEISDARKKLLELSISNFAIERNIGITWFKELQEEFSKPYFVAIGQFLEAERNLAKIYPPQKDIYSWTRAVSIYDVKVVIIGQDPYHGPDQAHGLAFSVRKGVGIPPSLRNIYKELSTDIPGFKAPGHGYLNGWASQGVLLLNTTLTVRAGKPDSHKERWFPFTDAVIKWIEGNLPNTVFMMWGLKAQQKLDLISKDKHLILTAGHPSPLSAHKTFFGCRHFSKANMYLKEHGKKEIDWNYLP